VSDEAGLRALICELGRRLYDRNLVAASDGNLSCRLGEGRYLITRSGISKGYMTPDDILIADGESKLVAGEGRVSSEFLTHLACYEERPETNAVIHAHTPYATALTIAGISLVEPILPEFVAGLGGVPTTSYATPGTSEGQAVVRPFIRHADVVMLDRHGAIAIGATLEEAYFKLEKLEHAAEIIHHARALGPVRRLTRDEIARLERAREAYGATGKYYAP